MRALADHIFETLEERLDEEVGRVVAEFSLQPLTPLIMRSKIILAIIAVLLSGETNKACLKSPSSVKPEFLSLCWKASWPGLGAGALLGSTAGTRQRDPMRVDLSAVTFIDTGGRRYWLRRTTKALS
ncbi:MAG: hypothetical protein ACREX9_06565 [Gammaproteobacteria bacterium]